MTNTVIEKIIREHMLKLHRAIEVACEAALPLECGVSVTTAEDGSYTVAVDPRVPRESIYEYRANGSIMGYGYDPYKLPYVEKMISSLDTP